MSQVIDRFLKYVSFDTQSADDMPQMPSTEKQWELAEELKRELEEMGAENVRMSENCYVYAEIPANVPEEEAAKIPALGFISHMDTAPALTGCNVKPQFVKDYDGEDICLNAEKQIYMRVSEFPFLKKYVGQDLITTDGTTLLGADDKAGVAEIMAAADYLLTHKEIPHGKICIGFTPDEEVGRGADKFDLEHFGAQFGYTVDGGELGEVEYENFNAASTVVTIHGCSMHTGDAKKGMVNSMLIGMEYQQMLPTFENPMYTEGYEGFFHLDHFNGDVENTVLKYLIRDHDREKFEKKKEQMRQIGDFLNQKYGEGTVEVAIRDSYFNMKEKIEPHMHLIDRVCASMKELDVEPVIRPIRGGTDGARLSYEGLPCPNLCTGGANFHGRYEFISVQAMEKMVQLLVKLMAAPQM